jgi:hypothetical protein
MSGSLLICRINRNHTEHQAYEKTLGRRLYLMAQLENADNMSIAEFNALCDDIAAFNSELAQHKNMHDNIWVGDCYYDGEYLTIDYIDIRVDVP